MITATELRFEPHQDKGSVRAFILAVVMHGLLLAFLYFGISWTSQPAAPAQADLWTALPPMSAPPPRVVQPPPPPPEPPKPKVIEPEPAPPPPVKADIVQKAEKKKEEPKKLPPPPKPVEKKPPPPPKVEKKEPPPKQEPAKKDLPKPEAKQPLDDIQAALQREERARQNNNINKLAAQELAGAPSSGASKDWVSKVGNLVRSKLPATIVDSVPSSAKAEFDVTLLPGRVVNTVTLVKSSGYPAYDEAARNAILAASPLPPPTGDMKDVPRNLRFPFTPKEVKQ